MVTVFVKELDREVEVQDVEGCYFTEYGECYCFDAEEVAELYQKGKCILMHSIKNSTC